MQPMKPISITAASTQELRAQLAQALTMTAHTLQHLADIWRELERRGEDLSDLRNGLAAYLPMIAAGQLDPEAVIAFAGSKTMLQRVSRLPVHDQRRLATGGKIAVLTITPDGKEIVEDRPALSLLASQAKMVFGEGRIITVNEQREMLYSAPARKIKKTADASIRADHSRGCLRVGRKSIQVSQVIQALGDLQGPLIEDQDEEKTTATFKLSATEKRALAVKAAESGLTMDHLIRTALKSMGVF